MSLFLQTLVLRGIYCPVSSRVETCIRRYEQHESFSDVEEFQMKKILTQYGGCALAVALMVPLAQAKPAGMPSGSEGNAQPASGACASALPASAPTRIVAENSGRSIFSPS